MIKECVAQPFVACDYEVESEYGILFYYQDHRVSATNSEPHLFVFSNKK